ncbi:HHIP-like protein 1 isoform X2 [Gigantopelta aegis]|uniref:HHIP-like protein 1 isoform X2 n=1 Tax=Gigantopelta aegis TaxID=1735272 RepID=UPI001B88E2F9|nr:HHIP-like protein 1 isoform X2 [Gigantopelta aegis]
MATGKPNRVLSRNVVHLFVLLSLPGVCYGHPQCLDSRPPFQPTINLTFCPQYSLFGCCNSDGDTRLRSEYYTIRSLVDVETWTRCHGYVRELLCQQCSPYAAHIFDAEAKPQARTFPGLCETYAKEFHNSCKDVVTYLDQVLAEDPRFETEHGFYSIVRIPDPDYCFPELLSNAIFNRNISNQQITKRGCLCLEEVALDLGIPILARHSGDGTNRLFIADQTGVVYIYNVAEKSKLGEPFLDIRDQVFVSSREGDERGFLGLAFHPSFKENKKFYIYYCTSLWAADYRLPRYHPDMPLDNKIRISEMTVNETDPNRANVSSERILLEVLQPFANHNGGEIYFGDDNFLYLFLGDGGAGGDPFGFSQNKSVLLGKVLRIDVDNGDPYAIPPDNPFVNDPSARDEIFAYGVRNIWRCGKDRGDAKTGEGKGRVLCGDVGQNAYEEIDMLVKGANYGWDSREGFACFDNSTCGKIGPEELPIFAYPHSVGKSVTGGSFYRGCESPNLNGLYIYGDYMVGRLFSLVQNSSGQWDNEELFMCGPDICLDGLIGNYGKWITSFGEDEQGEVYLLSVAGSQRKGMVYKFVDPARRGNPDQCPSANRRGRILSQTNVPTPETTNSMSKLTSIAKTTNSMPKLTSIATNQAPVISSLNVRACSMASTLLCTLLRISR